jgi:two-component system, chemotaxis family, protein-glutamate methylesterase/glutaminase
VTLAPATPVNATCPECRGPLSFTNEPVEFRCLVGHTYSAITLLQAHYEAQERALWAAVVVLEETVPLVDTLGPELSADHAERLKKQVETKLEQAEKIRKLLEDLKPFDSE